MSSKKESKGPAIYTHWKRPHTRMYDYNYQVAESYYKPQVQYAGYVGTARDRTSRTARRRSASPPSARTFLERWAADPFYGRTQDPLDLEREHFVKAMSRARSMTRASSIPNMREWVDSEEIDRQRNLRSTASRARSVVSYDGDFAGDYNDYVNIRNSRARSVSRPVNDLELELELERDREFDELVRMADRNERERSVFSYRMALDPDPRKVLMTTTLSHGCYSNSLYGTETWDPTSYLGR